MSKILDCVNGYKHQIPHLTSDELEDYLRQVMAKARDLDDLRPQAALREAQQFVNDATKRSFLDDAQVQVNNQAKYSDITKDMLEKKLNLRDFTVRRYTNLSNNIESSQQAAVNRMHSLLIDNLNEEELSFFQDEKNNADIAAAMDGDKASPQAKNVARVIKDYIDKSDAQLVASDAMPLQNLNKDRNFRAIHDRTALLQGGRRSVWEKLGNTANKVRNLEMKKLISGTDKVAVKERWINFIKQHLDMEKTFEFTNAATPEGDLDERVAHDMLGHIYDNIVTGKSEIYTKSAVLNDAEALRNRARMFFQWKDFKAFNSYNSEYGEGNLFSAAMRDAQAKGRKIGRSELFGSNPDLMYAELRRYQTETDPKSQFWMHNTDLAYKEVRGDSSAAVHPEMAQFFGNIRSATGMARLPGLLVTSLSDVNMAASYGWRWGISYGHSMVEQLTGLVKQGTESEQREIGRMMHLNLQSHMGYMGKFASAENLGNVTSKVSTHYYRAIGMQAWDQGNRIGIMHNIADHLGKNSSKSFANLPAMTQKQLAKFGITDKEWNVLRTKTPTGKDTSLFTLDNVKSLTDDDLKSYYDAKGGRYELNAVRNELYRKVFSMFETASENAILTPNAWMRAMMNQGLKAGTWPGEVMRTVMQFKGFALSYMDRALMQGFKDADGAGAKAYYAMQQFGFVVPLSYLSTAFYFMSQGRQMPDPSTMNFGQNVNYFAGLAMPGLGIFNSILDSRNQNQSLVSSMMLTPAMKLMGNLLAAPLAAVTGNEKTAKDAAVNALTYMAPSTAIPFAQPLTRSFLGEPAFK